MRGAVLRHRHCEIPRRTTLHWCPAPVSYTHLDVYKRQANSNPFGLGIARDALSVITDGNGKPWGMHPAMAETAPLFANGELAFMANVGSLTQPLSKSQYATDPLPPYLFSHNDQQRQWMRGHSTGTHVANGWGGLAGDLLAVQNTGLKELPPTISLFGNNLFQSGTSALPYALASSGPAELARMSSAGGAADSIRMQALDCLLYTSRCV